MATGVDVVAECLAASGEPGRNYLWAGYTEFYRHTFAAFTRMARTIQSGGTAADVVNWAGAPAR